MRTTVVVAKLGFLHRLAYRTEVVTSLVSATVVVGLIGSIWSAVGEQGVAVGGLAPAELCTYAVLAYLVATVNATRVDALLAERFLSGQIAADLCRPLDLQHFLLARDFGRGCAALVSVLVPVGGMTALWFPLAWPARVTTWILTALSLLISLGLAGQLAFLVGMASIILGDVRGLSLLRSGVVALFSGAVVPLTALPQTVQSGIAVLPFYGMAHVPTMVFLERLERADLAWAVGHQLLWLLILSSVSRLAWTRAVRRLTVQGG